MNEIDEGGKTLGETPRVFSLQLSFSAGACELEQVAIHSVASAKQLPDILTKPLEHEVFIRTFCMLDARVRVYVNFSGCVELVIIYFLYVPFLGETICATQPTSPLSICWSTSRSRECIQYTCYLRQLLFIVAR